MKVLILEDSKIIANGIYRYLVELYGCHSKITTEEENILNSLNDEYDIVIIDYNFAFKYWSIIQSKEKILISGDHLGIHSRFLQKPFDKHDLKKVIDSIIKNI